MHATTASLSAPPTLTPDQISAVVARAHDPIIVSNALSRVGGYSPYCMRCQGLVRMTQVELLYWRHGCGAEHDERHALGAIGGAVLAEASDAHTSTDQGSTPMTESFSSSTPVLVDRAFLMRMKRALDVAESRLRTIDNQRLREVATNEDVVDIVRAAEQEVASKVYASDAVLIRQATTEGDAERFALIAKRFDSAKTSASERVLEDLGFDPGQASLPLREIVDAALHASAGPAGTLPA